ncbi:S8 family peptidase [Actinokineospora fastidiosa]|uniref:Serine protease n=1 Tax=Actinokineospora fastidiosa TaxID=1816 RepID=A0A918GQ66_9PSEU|nr:S8 family serine peptidase [Actinokineospora fastidiosa]GGS49435.1 serine protease [Actinokineospora fastidiosa]
MLRKLACALAALALIAPPVSAEPAQAVTHEYIGSITLITGDHVTVRRVGDRLVPAVTPAPGRESVHFATLGTGDELHVVPADAWQRVNAGTLDRRLFDVAALLRDGYGDERRADLPLIVGSTLEPQTRAKHGMAAAWAAQDAPVWLDGLRHPTLDHTAVQIGAPSAWKSGYTGKGVTVAVLDTGVDATHPDLRGRVAEIRNFTDESTRDTDGHGTHVAATIASRNERYRGIAPDARLLVGKVCQANGCSESAIIKGMRWAAERGAKVVNLSLGGPDAAGSDPLEQAVDRLSAQHGTLFVVAAGNDGSYGAETVGSPASADAALAVGAVDRADARASFSARGPRVRDAAIKPEILAPGVDVVAARSRHSFGTGAHTALSGTSMATPHVAGAAAILAQRHPGWTGRQLKAALMGSAHPIDESVYDQGAGRVDVDRALGVAVTADPPALSFGRSTSDDPVTRTLTYRNPTDAAVPLTLGVTGPFTLSASAITVPARGEASVEVTAGAGDGQLSGFVTAAGVSTPLAIDREPESYDLTIRTVDTTGAPTDANFSFLFGGADSRYRPIPTIDGVGTVRVPRGTYHVDGVVATPQPDGAADSHKVVHPVVEVTRDTTLVIDARAARPISVDFDARGVTPKAVGVGYSRSTDTRAVLTGVLGDTFERIHLGQVGPPVEDIISNIGGAWTAPGDRAYHLAWFEYGPIPTGFSRSVRDAELARVDATYRRQAPRHRGMKMWIAREPRFDAAVGFGVPFDLPVARTEYHNVDDLTWSAEFHHLRGQATDQVVVGGPVRHGVGVHREDWNTAVFGPSLAGGDWAARFDDTISLAIPLFGDSANDRYGLSTVDYGRTVLFREGVKVGETRQPGQGQFEVPEEARWYRLETTATRKSVYSPMVTAAWSFTSQRPEADPKPLGKGGNGLPITAIRFAPRDLDLRNRAAAATIDVTLQPNTGSDPSPFTTLSIEASFDDGLTWHPLPATRTGPLSATTVVPDLTGEYVSLRARAVDERGSEAEVTVLRAYGI